MTLCFYVSDSDGFQYDVWSFADGSTVICFTRFSKSISCRNRSFASLKTNYGFQASFDRVIVCVKTSLFLVWALTECTEVRRSLSRTEFQK